MTLATSKTCARCSKAFHPVRSDQTYCGRRCKRAAERQRTHTANRNAPASPSVQAASAATMIPEPQAVPVLGFSPGDNRHPCLKCGQTSHRTTGCGAVVRRMPVYRLDHVGNLVAIDWTRASSYARLLLDLSTELLKHAAEPTPGAKAVSQAALDLANESLYELTTSLEKMWNLKNELARVAAAQAVR